MPSLSSLSYTAVPGVVAAGGCMFCLFTGCSSAWGDRTQGQQDATPRTQTAADMRLFPEEAPEIAQETQGVEEATSMEGWVVCVSLSCLRSSADTAAREVEGYRINEETLAALTLLHDLCSVTLVEQVSNEEEELRARRFVSSLLPDFPPHHLLFCETNVGRKAVYRQISPAVAIESCPAVADYLAPFLPHTCLIAEGGIRKEEEGERKKPAKLPFVAASLEEYVSILTILTGDA